MQRVSRSSFLSSADCVGPVSLSLFFFHFVLRELQTARFCLVWLEEQEAVSSKGGYHGE